MQFAITLARQTFAIEAEQGALSVTLGSLLDLHVYESPEWRWGPKVWAERLPDSGGARGAHGRLGPIEWTISYFMRDGERLLEA